MTHKVFFSLSSISALWDDFIPDNHPLQSKHLKVIEQSNLEDVSYRYLLIYNHDKELIAVAYFQWLHFRNKHYASPFAEKKLIHSVEKRIMAKGYRILINGNLLRIDFPGLYFKPDKVTISEIFDQFEKFFVELNPYPHAILIKDWNNDLGISWVQKLGYHPWTTDLTMKMNFPGNWRTFDDYVNALRHRYSQRERRARKKLGEIIRKELSSQEMESAADQLETLYEQVVEKQTIRLMPVNENYFLEMKKGYLDRFKVFGYFLNGEMVAFSSNILYDHLWEMHYIGLNYDLNEKHWIYFNMLFDAVADSISAGKKELELGRTAREAKTVLGAFPVYFKSYVRVKGFIPRQIVKFLGGYFNKKAGVEWKNRNPYKVSSTEHEENLNPRFQNPCSTD